MEFDNFDHGPVLSDRVRPGVVCKDGSAAAVLLAMPTQCRPHTDPMSTQCRRNVDPMSTQYRLNADAMPTRCRPNVAQCRAKLDQNQMELYPFGMIFNTKFWSRRDLSHCTLRIRLSQGIHIKNHQTIRVDLIQNRYCSKNVKFWPFGMISKLKFRSWCDLWHSNLGISRF